MTHTLISNAVAIVIALALLIGLVARMEKKPGKDKNEEQQ